jgi:hypothetical protein
MAVKAVTEAGDMRWTSCLTDQIWTLRKLLS